MPRRSPRPHHPPARPRRPSAAAGPGRVVGVEAGSDLAHYLAEAFPKIGSVRQIRRLLSEGRCRVNGVLETYGSRRLNRGDVVQFRPPAQQVGKPVTTRFEPARLLFDHPDMLAYDKPPRLAVTPTEGKTWDLLHLLRSQFGPLLPVHRLDADTSGVVVLARTPAAQARLEEQFRSRTVSKRYLALVRGHPKDAGERRGYLRCIDTQPGFEKWGSAGGPGSVYARTTWTVRERYRHGSLLEVEPHSGRTHQIRIHMADIGTPLYGDRLYGDRSDPVDVPRQMLHAWRLTLPHPDGSQGLVLKADEPEDFIEACRKVRSLR